MRIVLARSGPWTVLEAWTCRYRQPASGARFGIFPAMPVKISSMRIQALKEGFPSRGGDSTVAPIHGPPIRTGRRI